MPPPPCLSSVFNLQENNWSWAKIFFHVYLLYVCVCMHHGMHVRGREQFARVGALPSPCGRSLSSLPEIKHGSLVMAAGIVSHWTISLAPVLHFLFKNNLQLATFFVVVIYCMACRLLSHPSQVRACLGVFLKERSETCPSQRTTWFVVFTRHSHVVLGECLHCNYVSCLSSPCWFVSHFICLTCQKVQLHIGLCMLAAY